MTLRHAAVARHVLWLTLRRERPRISAAQSGAAPAALAAPETLSARWQSTAAALHAPSDDEHTVRVARGFGPAHRSSAGANAEDDLGFIMESFGNGLSMSPVGDGRSERVPHRDRPSAQSRRTSSPTYSTAAEPPLLEDLLSLLPEHAAPLISAFLSSVQPSTVGAINRDVRRLRKLIKHMSPSRAWAGLDDDVRRALLALWARWLGLVIQLRDVGGLPRMGGREGAEFAPGRFTPLFLALLSSPSSPRPARQSTHAVDARVDTMPALSAALALMASVDARPTDFQLELIVRHLMPSASVRDILDGAWVACARDDPGVAAVRLLEFVHPESAPTTSPNTPLPTDPSALATPPPPEQWPAARARLLLACGDVALAHLEGDRHGDTPASTAWWAAAADMVQDWTSLVAGYQARYVAALRGSNPGVAPTAVEAHALHLLARYALVRARPRDMRSAPLDLGATDVGDPLACLSLLLGAASAGTSVHSRSTQVDKRVVSVIVRWAHHAASRRLLWPIISLLDVLSGQTNPALGSAIDARGRTLSPPPLPVRTALFLAGAAREPEDLLRILPSLETLAVEPDAPHAALMATPSDPPHPIDTPLSAQQRAYRSQRRSARRVPLRVLALAQEADARGLRLPDSPASLAARVRAMFDSWGLPHLVEESERRTAHAPSQVVAD